MLLAQILFVDNSTKEGLPDRIEDAARATVVDSVAVAIRACSAANGAALALEDARFYASLSLVSLKSGRRV
jgi:hypothetical protein